MIILILSGCQNNQLTPEQTKYNNFITEIKNTDEPSIDVPFTAELKLDKLTGNEYRYKVTIDEPLNTMYSVEAVVFHNLPTKDVFPSSGIFEEPLVLSTSKEDAVKGLILIGYVQSETANIKQNFRLLVKYRDAQNRLEVVSIFFK